MAANQASLGPATAFQAAANTLPEHEEDEARPLPTNDFSRYILIFPSLKQAINVICLKVMIRARLYYLLVSNLPL